MNEDLEKKLNNYENNIVKNLDIINNSNYNLHPKSKELNFQYVEFKKIIKTSNNSRDLLTKVKRINDESFKHVSWIHDEERNY